MSHTYTKKSLISADYHIDPLKASRFAFERYTIPVEGSCTDPMSLNHDQYGRIADASTLTTNTQGGSCNFSSPFTSVVNFMNIENQVSRPYIYIDGAGKSSYDTMGFGRNMQKTYTGGNFTNRGGFERLNMDRNNKSNIQMCVPPTYRTTDPSLNKSMSAAMNSLYNA